MTAELLVFAATPAERRRSPRLKPAQPVRTLVGRATGTLADLSATGARILHTSAVVLGTQVRLRFEWNGEVFEATADVLVSRVVSISAEGTLFESRVRFLPLSDASAAMLARVLLELGTRNLHEWMSNLQWTTDPDGPR